MRILIINELAKSGGAEMQSMRECELLRQFGNESMVLTLDPNFTLGWNTEYHYNISLNESVIKHKLQMLFVDRSIVKEIRGIIKQFKPCLLYTSPSPRDA